MLWKPSILLMPNVGQRWLLSAIFLCTTFYTLYLLADPSSRPMSLKHLFPPQHPSEELSQKADNFTQSWQFSMPQSRPNYSNPWIPLVLTECTFGMPSHYAPCVAKRLQGVVHAEELIYPGFEIREPYFARAEHATRWREVANGIRERASLHTSGWLVYHSQAGQNFVFENASYTGGNIFDQWSNKACMNSFVSTSPIHIHPDGPNPESKETIQTLFIASSPDSYSFQHHLDRVTHIMSQGAHLKMSEEAPYVLTGRKGNNFVQELWGLLGVPKDHVLHQGNADKVAERLIFSCRAVLIHPWLSLRTLETFGIDYLAPSTVRNTIMYMSRSNGKIRNLGRKVINEEALLDSIREYLVERNLGEELVVFNEDEFKTAPELFAFFSQKVKAIIGPHGGALFHHRWCAKGTFILEFMPTTFTSMIIYEEASLLSQTYANMIVEPTEPSGKDMEIDPIDVLFLLKRHLGFEHPDPLRESYPWNAKELHPENA